LPDAGRRPGEQRARAERETVRGDRVQGETVLGDRVQGETVLGDREMTTTTRTAR
jgi:hypothetical protein